MATISGRLRSTLKGVVTSVRSWETDIPSFYAEGRFNDWKPRVSNILIEHQSQQNSICDSSMVELNDGGAVSKVIDSDDKYSEFRIIPPVVVTDGYGGNDDDHSNVSNLYGSASVASASYMSGGSQLQQQSYGDTGFSDDEDDDYE